MTNVKNMAAFVAAFVCVMVNFVLTSCQADSESVRTEYAAPKTVETPVLVYQDKLVNIVSNVYFDGKTIVVGDKVAATVDVAHQEPVIEMPAEKHAAATITSSSDLEWRDSNGQNTTGTLNIVAGDNYEIFGTLYPAANYSTLTKVHPKVSVVNTHHTFEGSVNVTVENDTKSKSFNFDLARQYFLVDPTVDVEIVNTHTTDTLIQVVVKTDTLINTVVVEKHDTTVVEKTVTLTDTIKVEVERFVRGADVVKSVVNDFGFSKATMTLGSKQLLAVEIRHQYPILDVEESILGSANFSNVAALSWDGTDGQKTNGTVNAQGCTVDGVEYLRSEANTLLAGSLAQIRTIYRVYGTYKNENGDICEFTMELAPSYLQKYEAAVVTPQVEDKFAWTFTDKLTYETANGVCKGMLKVTGEKKNLATGEVVATANLGRTNVIKIGHPTGLDLYVTSTDIIGYDKDIRPFTDNDQNWNGTTEKSGFEITKQTTIYEFSTWFAADAVAGGKVGPQTQLYFLSCEVSFKDPETGEVVYHKVFEKNATSNTEEFITEDALVGQTKVQSDKTYKYEKSYKRTFKAYIDGKEIFSPEAVSSLWTPVK